MMLVIDDALSFPSPLRGEGPGSEEFGAVDSACPPPPVACSPTSPQGER